MSAPFPDLLRCTVGGSEFQLKDYAVDSRALVVENLGRTGTAIRVSGTGWIEGTSAADFSSKLTAVQTAMNVTGQDFRVYGLGGSEEFALPAAVCLDGGPHVSYVIAPQLDQSILRKRIDFTIEARTGSVSFTAIPPISTYKQEITTGPDGLRRVTRTGTITQSAASGIFLGTILPAFRSTYAAPDWAAVNHRYSADGTDSTLDYSITADELAQAYPAGAASIVDGEALMDRRRDEQHRMTEVWDFDLLLSSGDYQSIIDLIRAELTSDDSPVVRETVSVTIHKQTRLRCTFEFLDGGDGNQLVSWQQSFDLDDSAETWEEKTYPGALSIIVQQPESLPRLMQSGSATGAGVWITAPDPLFPDRLNAKPKISYKRINDFEFQTSWSYAMVIDDDDFAITAATLNELDRPDNPELFS